MLTAKTFEGVIMSSGYDENLFHFELTSDGDIIAFYSVFGGSDDGNYPGFVKFDAKTGTQKMAYWYDVTSYMEYNVGTVDKDGNIWITGYNE
jgi:hypothetical protein